MSTKEPDLSNIKVSAPSAAKRTARSTITTVLDTALIGSGGALGATVGILAAHKLDLVGGENPSALRFVGAVVLTTGGIIVGSNTTAWVGEKMHDFFGKDCQ